MQSQRQQQIAEQLAQIGARFLEKESNRQSLITVTRANVAPNLAHATIFFTVFPDSYQDTALEFTKRKRKEFRAYLRKQTNLRRIPFIDFAIDEGEKYRQHLDTLDIKTD